MSLKPKFEPSALHEYRAALALALSSSLSSCPRAWQCVRGKKIQDLGLSNIVKFVAEPDGVSSDSSRLLFLATGCWSQKGATSLCASAERCEGDCPTRYKEKVMSAAPGRVEIEVGSVY